jgi:hypothetical protein
MFYRILFLRGNDVGKKAFIIWIAVSFCLGLLCAGFGAYLYQSRQIDRFDERIASLDREYTKRQRELEVQLAESRRIVTYARAITDRTAESLGRTAGNITEAIGIIKEIYQQIQDLDRILTGGSSGSGGDGGVDRNELEEMKQNL